MSGQHEVFIGNIPYGVTEEEIKDVLRRVGNVVRYRPAYDKETGKPKGYAFAEFSFPEEAESAVRNLDNHELQGRKIRVNWAQSAVRTHAEPAAPVAPVNSDPSGPLPDLPEGRDLESGLTAEDTISKTLNTLPPTQLLDIVRSMQTLAVQNPARAQQLLTKSPQLSYAIFQALLQLGLIDTQTLQTTIMQTSATPAPPPQAYAAPPAPPQSTYQPVQQYQPPPVPQYPPAGYPNMIPTPVQQPYGLPPAAPPVAPPPGADKEALIKQVMEMSEEAINSLRPEEQHAIRALRAQILQGKPI